MLLRKTFITGAVAAAMAAAVAGAVVPAAAAPISPVAVGQVGFSGHAALYGWGAATMLDGSVLIGDYWNMKVQHFAADGTRLPDFINNPGFGADQNQAPYGMAVDPTDGSVYVADTDRFQIKKYDATGRWISNFGAQCKTTPCPVGSFKYPSRVAVDSAGQVFVVDTWDHRISVHAKDGGAELSRFGSFGAGPTQFKSPHGMSIDTIDGVDYLFVADTSNKRVQQLALDGTFVRAIGSAGSKIGQFKGDLRGLAIDKVNHKMFVVDAYGNRINTYDTLTGLPLNRFGTFGQGPGQFYDGGREATIDGEGNLWVGDMPNFRVQKFQGFSRTGTQPVKVGTPLLQYPAAPSAPPLGGLNSPRGVTTDPAGNVYVVDTYNQRIQKYGPAPDYAPIVAWGMRGGNDTDFSYPRLISYSAVDDTVVVADSGNYSVKKMRAGNLAGSVPGEPVWSVGKLGTGTNVPLDRYNQPQAVTVAPDGTIYVADSLNGRVVQLTSAGVPVKAISSKGTALGQLSYPRALTVDPVDGTLWVVDSPKRRVLHFDPETGNFLGQFGKPGSLDNQLNGPFGIVADADNIYIADAADHKVKVFTKLGVGVQAFGGLGSDLGQLRDPNGLALGADGKLFVVEQRNDRVSVWTLH